MATLSASATAPPKANNKKPAAATKAAAGTKRKRGDTGSDGPVVAAAAGNKKGAKVVEAIDYGPAGPPPKAPLAAYMRFTQVARPRLKNDHPDAKFGELGKMMGAEWRAMSAEAKAPFESAYQADKAVYDKSKEAWKAAGGVPIKKAKRARKEPKAAAPKKKAKKGTKAAAGGKAPKKGKKQPVEDEESGDDEGPFESGDDEGEDEEIEDEEDD